MISMHSCPNPMESKEPKSLMGGGGGPVNLDTQLSRGASPSSTGQPLRCLNRANHEQLGSLYAQYRHQVIKGKIQPCFIGKTNPFGHPIHSVSLTYQRRHREILLNLLLTDNSGENRGWIFNAKKPKDQIIIDYISGLAEV